MTRIFFDAKIRLQQAIAAREAGQGTLEYLGIVVVAAILVVGLITAFNTFELGTMVSAQLAKITAIIPG